MGRWRFFCLRVAFLAGVISFYIFQTSAYLIDISRGKHRAERSFLRYALFVCYFPQLVQGPINRFADLQPQLTAGNDFSWDNIQHGFLRMLYGVLKSLFPGPPCMRTAGFAAFSGRKPVFCG